ncbi:MAG TPA: transcriptional regulator [Deltaproteobacteria bacterium]|nr:transcriptional regulator [Deltaproteobacteria bacterium]
MEDTIFTQRLIQPDTVSLVKQRLPGNEDLFQELAFFFKAFGDATRLKILFALCASPLCVGDLAAVLAMNQSAVSHQLKALSRARLVSARKNGKVVYYRLRHEQVKNLLAQGFEQIRS